MSHSEPPSLERRVWLAMIAIGLVGAALLAWATSLPSGAAGLD